MNLKEFQTLFLYSKYSTCTETEKEANRKMFLSDIAPHYAMKKFFCQKQGEQTWKYSNDWNDVSVKKKPKHKLFD